MVWHLDKSRDFGRMTTVFQGAAYSQAGPDGRERYYDVNGNRIFLQGEAPEDETRFPRPKRKAAPPPAPKRSEMQAEAIEQAEAEEGVIIPDDEDLSTFAERERKTPSLNSPAARKRRRDHRLVENEKIAEAKAQGKKVRKAKNTPKETDSINLVAWALGEEKYPFGDIKVCFRDRYSRDFSRGDDARDFMVEQGLITEGQLRDYYARVEAARQRAVTGGGKGASAAA